MQQLFRRGIQLAVSAYMRPASRLDGSEAIACSGLAVVTDLSGIGAALAAECAAQGFDVFACSERGDLLDHASSKSSSPTRVHATSADLSDREGIDRLVTLIEESGRAIEALVINLSAGPGRTSLDHWLDDELLLVGRNVSATVQLIRKLVPAMVARRCGRIMISTCPTPPATLASHAVYDATVAFVQCFTAGLHTELEGTHVTLTSLRVPPPSEPASSSADALAARAVRAMLDGQRSCDLAER